MLWYQWSQSIFILSCGRIYCDFTSITDKMEKEEQGDATATWGKFAVFDIYSKSKPNCKFELSENCYLK